MASEVALPVGDRFVVEHLLGRGGMGIVYQVHDRERRERVALKTLTRFDPLALLRLKREFRSLADVTHGNLVQFYELFSAGGLWCFTMELVPGIDFLSYVRGVEATAPAEREATDTSGEPSAAADETDVGGLTVPARPASAGTPLEPPAAIDRLVPALLQLAEGLDALHGSGHLHCDVKPRNVLVTAEGRVVLVNFGLATALRGGDGAVHELAGTPAYMAPELFAHGEPTPASDWYAFGVMLYEALAGVRPFTGELRDIAAAKLGKPPRPPSAVRAGVSAELDALCAALLTREPARRPAGEMVIERLEEIAGRDTRSERGAAGEAWTGELVGRKRHLLALHEALARVRRGAPAAVLVRGRSGMGKSALIGRFLDDCVEQGAVVLAGRCYERESVPYKAVDALVDALCAHLMTRPGGPAPPTLPDEVRGALASAFPVLRRIPSIGASSVERAAAEPTEQRRRAFAGLRALLAQVAQSTPLVLFIDDLQWGDADSAPLLASLVSDPTAPLLLIASYREEEAESHPLIRELSAAAQAADPHGIRRLHVTRLSLGDARRLAGRLMAEAPPELIERIARESAGNPFFVHELVRYARTHLGTDTPPPLTLDAVLARRVDAVSAEARRLLEVVCVAGLPLVQATAWAAAEVRDARTRALAELGHANLVRTTGARGSDRVEPYHDRIRETVVANLPAAVARAHHLGLARALEADEPPDVEVIAFHFAAAREAAPALRYALLAGGRAAAAFAFDRAASWYGAAVDLGGPGPIPAELLGKLGDALAHAGRGRDAAEAYRSASAAVAGDQALALRGRAAGELLRSGYIDEGIDELAPALAAVGLRLPHGPRRTLLGLLARRLLIALRGLRYRERDERALAPAALTRIDLCWAAACGLAMIDTIQGAAMQARYLQLALRAGEPRRVGRALTLELGYRSVGGPPARRRVDRVLAALQEVADASGEPALHGMCIASQGLAAYQVGQWKRAREHAETAERVLREQSVGVHWESMSTRLYWLWSLYYLGETGELRGQVRRFRDEAAGRGDRYAATSMSIGLPAFADLAAGDCALARERAEEAIASWSGRGYHLQHYWALVSLVHCDLYEGRGRAAHQRMVSQWDSLRRSFLLRIHTLRVEALHMRARTALAAAAENPADAEGLRRAALADARRIERERAPWSTPLARLIRAGVQQQRARPGSSSAEAIATLATAEPELQAADMLLYAAAARRRRGELLGDDEGARLVAEADGWMAERAVRDPSIITAVLAPGSARNR